MARTSRRTFAKTLTAATVALPLVAQTPPKEEQKPPSPVAKAFTELVRAESGQYLNDEDIDKIGKSFERGMQGLQRVRDFKLSNSDEPDFTFAWGVRRWS